MTTTRIPVDEYRGHKISVDENGQFRDGERCFNPGTSLRQIKEEIDFLDAYEKATPVKVLRIEFPYLQVWHIRKVSVRRHGYERIAWFTKDDPHYGPDHLGYPRDFAITSHIVRYDEAMHQECERLFKQMQDNNERLFQIRATWKMPEMD
jgi:hypothetical protein